MKIFKDRQSAGKLLAGHLKQYEGKKNTIVLAIPRGGVVVAKEVARNLKLPLDIIVTRKIGALSQPELALGAVNADGEIIWEHKLSTQLKLRIDNGQLTIEIEKQKEEIRRREKVYRQDKGQLNIKRKTVILVDDGMATGATVLSAVRYIRRHQSGSQGTPALSAGRRGRPCEAKLILAVPVASQDSIEKIKREVTEVVVLETPDDFQAVGQFYYKFEPVTDVEVVQLLK